MNDTPTQPLALDAQQQVRAECLNVARAALSGSATSGAAMIVQGLPEHRDVPDLVDVAVYIETGAHPYDRNEKPATSPSDERTLVVVRPQDATAFPEALRETAKALSGDGSLSAALWLDAVADALDAQAVTS